MQTLATWTILGADDSESGIFKLIVPLILALVWVVSQVLSRLGSKKPERTGTDDSSYPDSVPPDTLPPQRPPQQQRPMKQRVDPRQQQRQRQLAQRQRTDRAMPPPLQQPETRTEPGDPLSSVSPLAAQPLATPSRSKRRDHAAIDQPTNLPRLQAMLRPGNLKKAFIITEILQTPVGMRDDRV